MWCIAFGNWLNVSELVSKRREQRGREINEYRRRSGES